MRRPAPQRDMPPPLELECLKALWGIGEGTVRDVRHVMVGNRNLAYTTVMTVLDRLARRGLITRAKTGRAFIYAPAVSRDKLRRLALQEFLDSYFESSQDQLLRFLQSESRVVSTIAPVSSGLDPALL